MPGGVILIFLFLFLFGCSTQDPSDGVNHVHLGKYVIDLTFGPVMTLIVAPFIVWGVQFVITQKFRKWEAESKAAQETKARLEQERHEHITGMIENNREQMMGKMESICDRFDKVDARFYRHGHSIRREEDGSFVTADIVIKQTGSGI